MLNESRLLNPRHEESSVASLFFHAQRLETPLIKCWFSEDAIDSHDKAEEVYLFSIVHLHQAV